MNKFSLIRLFRDIQAHGNAGGSAEIRACSSGRRGLLLPVDALDRVETRDIDLALQGGTPEGYGPGTVLAASLSPALRPAHWAQEAGVVEVSGLEGRGEIVLPVEVAEVEAEWIADGAQATERQPGVSGVSVSPRTVATWARVTRGMLQQSSVAAENWVRTHLQRSLDDGLFEALLAGTGLDEQPLGIIDTPGVHFLALASAADPKVPTRDELVSLHALAAKADADPRKIVFVMSPVTAEALRKTETSVGSGRYVLDTNAGTGMQEVAGVAPVLETSHAPPGVVVAGDFTQAVAAKWSDPLDIIVNPFGEVAMAGGVDVHLFMSADAAACQRRAFAVGR